MAIILHIAGLQDLCSHTAALTLMVGRGRPAAACAAAARLCGSTKRGHSTVEWMCVYTPDHMHAVAAVVHRPLYAMMQYDEHYYFPVMIHTTTNFGVKLTCDTRFRNTAPRQR